MKKLLLFSLMIVFQSFFGQILFEPYVNHNYQPYTASISGNGRIYYTTDGTDPNSNSASSLNNVNITINQTTILKAKLADGNVFSRKYFLGTLPYVKIFFKPPSNWNSSCVTIDMTNPTGLGGFILDTYGAGAALQKTDCEEWYKLSNNTFAYEEANLQFNNCPIYYDLPGAQYSDTIPAGSIIYYDYSSGPISNPPACLLAVNDPSKKIAMVKIFPNPVQDYVNIESDKNFISYEIIDESGKLIVNKDFRGSKIDISNLKTGIYYIKLKSLSNETNIVKFIKK